MLKGETMKEWAGGSRWNVPGSGTFSSLEKNHLFFPFQPKEDTEAALQPFVGVLFTLGIQCRHIRILYKWKIVCFQEIHVHSVVL